MIEFVITFMCVSLFGIGFGIYGLINSYNTMGAIVVVSVCSISFAFLTLLLFLSFFGYSKNRKEDPYQNV